MRSFSILFVSFLLFILFFCFLLFSRIVDTPVFFVVVAISQLNEIGSGVSCHCVRWTKGISLPNRPRLIWIVRFTILILLWCICFACLSRYSWQVKCLLAEFPLVSIGCCIFFMDFDGRFVTIRSWLEKICASVCRSSPLTDYLLMLNISTFFFFFLCLLMQRPPKSSVPLNLLLFRFVIQKMPRGWCSRSLLPHAMKWCVCSTDRYDLYPHHFLEI